MARKTKQTETTTTTTTPVAAPVVEQEAVNEVVDDAATDASTLREDFEQLLKDLSSMRSHITSLSNCVRTLRSRSEREIKTAQKASRKRKNPNRKPSGFVKPTPISAELATFLGKAKGVEMARTEVTREINQYIKANNLSDPENGRRILADAKLRKLLNINKTEELTYFNLQKFIKHHFYKATPVAAEASA